MGYIILNPILVERLIEPITSGGGSGLGKRQRLWALGINAWLEEPITGIGYGQFERIFGTDIGLHNTYLIYLVETGIVGLVLFASIVISPVIDSIKHYSKEPTAFIFAAYIAFLLIHGIFHGVDNYRTLWLSIGIVAALIMPE
jgi:O-antigen ligase